MHIPDGFLSPPVWLALDAISLPAVGWAARRASAAGDGEHRIPLWGVMGAFVFAAQMINFPVGPGASGHLLGGALLAIVLGPAAAAVVMTAILVLQALIFQDGGILVLGANVFNMALAGVAIGYLPLRLWGRSTATIFAGGALSVLVSASLALMQLLFSGVTMPASVLWASAGLFTMGALLEGAITVAAIRAIERLSPGALRTPAAVSRRARYAMVCAALALVLLGVLVASTDPDSLETLAAQLPLQEIPAWLNAPLANYEAQGVPSEWGRKAVAGLIGLSLTYAVCVLGARRK